MTDVATLVILTLPLVIAAAYDWYVAGRFTIAALEKPYITMLTAGAWVRIGIAILTTITAFLGMTSLWFYLTGVRVIPQPVGTILLYVATLAPSIANLYFLRIRGDEL